MVAGRNECSRGSWRVERTGSVFGEALQLFEPDQPFFNSYFFRNALLFCGAIHYDRGNFAEAASFYRRVLDQVEQSSFDYFDALSHLGRIAYAQEQWDDAASTFEKAVQTQRFSENEYVVDTWFWIARCHLKREEPGEAKKYLEKIAATEVRYEKKPQAAERGADMRVAQKAGRRLLADIGEAHRVEPVERLHRAVRVPPFGGESGELLHLLPIDRAAAPCHRRASRPIWHRGHDRRKKARHQRAARRVLTIVAAETDAARVGTRLRTQHRRDSA